MKIRIYHVIESGDLSGSGRMVANICNRLDPAKFDITLIHAVRPSVTLDDFESIFHKHIRKIYLPDMVRNPNPVKDISALIKLYGIFRKERPDIVHGHSSKGGFLARCAALFAGVGRIFYSSHGYSFRMTDVSLLNRISFFLLEALASPIGYIVVNAPCELNIARKLARRGRVLPFYNGIDISGYSPSYPADTRSPVVVACGRITAARNPAAFVRLCSRLEKQYPSVSFVWIGDGSTEDRNDVELVVRHYEIKNLRITGWLPISGVKEEISHGDIFIHYSKWDVLPTVVSEAMALGKPVVGSTAVDQIIHGENGYIAKSEDDLFHYTCQLLNSWEIRNSMGKKARRTIENEYNLSTLIIQLEKAYLSLQ